MSTTTSAEPPAGRRRRRAWGAGVAFSVVLHAVPVVLAGGYWFSRAAIEPAPEPMFEVEMMRLQAPPRPPSDRPPGPKQVEAAPQPSPPKPLFEPRLKPLAAPDVESLAVVATPPRVETTSTAPPAPETTAPPSRPAPPAAATASSARTWEGMVLAHLERRKRYPTEARAQRRQGVVYVRFSMDRQGRVLSASLERSSGSAALDREAVALLGRAQPLPKPPPEVVGDPLSLSVPVEFFMRG
ncbi:energy transducer TonB family protein [Caulobacter mirabilis]|nr:energy transducer TonB [Caulobacter mirabilis]